MSVVEPADTATRAPRFILGDSDLEELYEQAPCGYLTLLDDGTIVRVNQTFLQWSGRERSDVLGARFPSLLTVGDRIIFDTHCQPQLRLRGAVDEVAIDVRCPDGSRRPAFVNAVRTAATESRPALTRVVVFGARERRQYEKELLTALRQAEAADAQRRVAEAELAHRTRHDAATGLPNRAGFGEWLEELRTATDPAAAMPVVLLIDLGSVRAVEDELDSAAAEEFVAAALRRIRAVLPATAGLARISPARFAVADVLPTDRAAGALASVLLNALADPVPVRELDVMTESTIGVVRSLTPQEDVDSLLQRAGAAQAEARRKGGAGWHLDSGGDANERSGQRLRSLSELRRAISDDDLILHYQPQYELSRDELSGVEALVRWQHPTQGLLGPQAFIGWAEESGLICELGAHVLDRAVAQAAAWNAGRARPLAVSVNLSARQLADNRLVAVTAATLARHSLAPAQLVLEITETALMSDAAAAFEVVSELKGLGVQVSIDDFGTGYSSLSHLRQMPVDELKIDRSFVNDMDSGAAGRAIVAGCIQLGHALGLRVVAEGIETAEQQASLRELGCDVGQGYHLGRPAPADILVEQLAERT